MKEGERKKAECHWRRKGSLDQGEKWDIEIASGPQSCFSVTGLVVLTNIRGEQNPLQAVETFN